MYIRLYQDTVCYTTIQYDVTNVAEQTFSLPLDLLHKAIVIEAGMGRYAAAEVQFGVQHPAVCEHGTACSRR